MSADKKKFSGWLVVAGGFLLCFFVVAITSNTLALFMAPICQEFGFDTASYSIVTLVGTLVNAFGAMALAPILSKKSIKHVMVVCGLITGILFAVMGFCSQIWQFALVFGLCNVGLVGVSQMPISILINKWFVDKRSIALSLCFCGGGIGAAIWSPIFGKIMAGGGWRTCYFLGGALIVIVSIFVCLILVKNDPQSAGEAPYTDGAAKSDNVDAAPKKQAWLGVDKGVAMKHPAFFLLLIGIFCLGCLAAGVSTHVINYLVGSGWELTAASGVLSAFSLCTVISMLIGGVLFDKLGLKAGALLCCVCGVLGLVCLTMADGNHLFAYAYAFLFAICLCMPKMLPVLATTAVFGDKPYAAVYSVLNFAMVLGCALGSVITGVVNVVAGYKAAWFVYIAFAVILFVCVAAAVATSKKLHEQYPNPVEVTQ